MHDYPQHPEYPLYPANAAGSYDSVSAPTDPGDGPRDPAATLQPGKFSVMESLKIGFKTVFRQPWVWVGSMLITCLALIVLYGIERMLGIDPSGYDPLNGETGGLNAWQQVIAGAAMLVVFVIDQLVSLNTYRNAYRAFRGERITLESFLDVHGVIKPFIASVLVYILTVVGFVLLIIPGIVVVILLGATPALMMLTSELSIGDGMKATARWAKRNVLSLIVLGILGLLITVVSALAFVLPYLIVAPAVSVALAAAIYVGFHGRVHLPEKA